MAVIGATQIEPVNFLEEYARGLQIGAGRRALERQEVERIKAAQQEDELRNYLASADFSSPEVQNQLIRQFGAKGVTFANALGEMESAKLNRKKVESDIARQDREAEVDGLNKAFRFVTGALEDPATYPAAYQQALQFIPAEKLAAMGITEQYDPKALKSVANSLVSAAERIDAELRGRAVKVQERQIGLAEKKQKFEESQASQPSADDLVVARTETAADGTVRMYNKFGKLLKTEKGAGKPSAQFERSRAVKAETQKNLNEVISSLEDISKKDGLIDQSTGSGIGRGVDVVAGFFGQSTPGAEAIARLKPIADQVLKLVPRFEGPQSDKDTQSYREAAGQLGDPTLPSAVRKAAAKEIIDIYKRRRNQFTISGEELTVAPSEGWGNLEVVE
jgi:hypothetical protein